MKQNRYLRKITNNLFNNGYVVVENILSHKECKKYIVEIEKINNNIIKNKNYLDFSKYGQIAIKDLIFLKPQIFLKIIDKKFVINFLSKIFNDVFILDNVMASNSIYAGNKYSRLVHMDAHLPCVKNENTTDIIAFFCLEDFNKESGSTKIWPGSHKTGIRIQNAKNYKQLIKKKSIYLKAKRGSCVFILGQTWHQIGKNLNKKSRWGIFVHYKRWWIKPSTDFTKCGSKIFKLLSLKQKELLSFNSISPKYNFKKKISSEKTLRDINKLGSNYQKIINY